MFRPRIPAQIKQAVLESSHGHCYLCGQSTADSQIAFDHMIPLSRGGADSVDNLRAVHYSCNGSKASKTPCEFWKWLLYYRKGWRNIGRDFRPNLCSDEYARTMIALTERWEAAMLAGWDDTICQTQNATIPEKDVWLRVSQPVPMPQRIAVIDLNA